jgi:tetratricopeptide (TPR) repeat protein
MRGPYSEAVELWRADGDRRELANALYNYSFCFSFATAPGREPGEIDPDGIGSSVLEEALTLYRKIGDEEGEANVLWGIGNHHYFGADPGAGVEEFEAALAIHRRVGNRTMEAWSLHMLGLARLRLDQLEVARTSFREAMRQFHGSGDIAGVTLVLDDFASLAAADGDAERAARLWGAARSLTATTGTGLAQFVDEAFDHLHRPTVHGMLDASVVERLAGEGATLTVDQAVAYSLGDLEPGWLA